MRRYAIIGGGVATYAAAEAIRAQDAAAEIRVIAEEAHEFYSRPGLAYWLTGEVPKEFLFPFNEKDFQGLNLQRWRGRAEKIDSVEHRVLLSNGAATTYDRLLIATGAVSTRLSVPGADLAGVVKLDSLDDAAEILHRVRRARTAVVIGGGITALELAEGLAAQGVHTHYLLRGERYWSSVLDEAESRTVEAHLKEHGLELHFNTQVVEVLGKKGRVSAVRIDTGQPIACEIVGVAIGIRPRKELAEAASLRTGRGIKVNERLQTSHPDVYAAGDVAEILDPQTGQSFLDSLWNSARQQGQVAGLNLSGGSAAYIRKVSLNVTRLGGLTTTILGAVGNDNRRDNDLAGIARGDSEAWRQNPQAVVAEQGGAQDRIRILVGPKVIAGAVIMGDQALSRPLQDLIEHQVEITPIRAALVQPDASLSAILTPFWKQWKKEHAA